jgi:hypothetical protein
MKKIMLMMAVSLALFSCGQKQGETAKTAEASVDSLGGTLTTLDEKTKAIQAQIKAYQTKDSTYKGEELAENIQVYYPSDTTADLVGKKAYLADFFSNQNLWENSNFGSLRVATLTLNNGEVWTNVWGIFTAKGKYSGKDILIPVHQALLWVNDKETKEIHFYDTKLIMDELAAKAAAEKK